MKKPPKGASWQRQEASWIPAFAGMTERRGKDQGRTNNRTDEDRTRFPPAPKAPLACEKSARGAERHSHCTNMQNTLGYDSAPRIEKKCSGEHILGLVESTLRRCKIPQQGGRWEKT